MDNANRSHGIPVPVAEEPIGKAHSTPLMTIEVISGEYELFEACSLICIMLWRGKA